MTDKLKGIDTDKKYVEIGSVAYVRTYLVALRDISSIHLPSSSHGVIVTMAGVTSSRPLRNK